MKTTPDRRARIAMFYPHGSFSVVRGIADAACLLADAGYEVDVFYRRTPDYEIDRLQYPGVHVTDDAPAVFHRGPVNYPRWLTHGTGAYGSAVTRGPHRWWRERVLYPRLHRRHQSLPYACVIGLDWHGLEAAGPVAKTLGVPLVYWSLELLYRDDLPGDGGTALKRMETEWSRRAKFTIVQDRWRAKALAEENGLDESRLVLVPNAPNGKARRQPSSVLRDRHRIGDTQRIAICTGFLRPWAMSRELVESAAAWPKDWVLYMQSKAKPGEDESDYSASVIDGAASGKVIMGLDPVPRTKFDGLLDAADIGVALYNPWYRGDGRLDKNLELMGYASGKLADYLHCGLPIITTRLPGVEDLVERYGCGVCVDSHEEVPLALAAIGADYAAYSAGAVRAFDEELELGKHFAPVIERLATLPLTS